MKKHIFGLAIFSFVVFAAAFVYGILTSPIIDSDDVSTISTHGEFKREINQSETTSPNVAQAVYNVKTKTLTWQGVLPNEKAATHFNLWTRDRISFTFIGSIPVENMADGNVHISSELNRSLRKIASSENLYLIGAGNNSEENDQFMIKLENAVSVTINHDE